jgi:hypothetical protein
MPEHMRSGNRTNILKMASYGRAVVERKLKKSSDGMAGNFGCQWRLLQLLQELAYLRFAKLRHLPQLLVLRVMLQETLESSQSYVTDISREVYRVVQAVESDFPLIDLKGGPFFRELWREEQRQLLEVRSVSLRLEEESERKREIGIMREVVMVAVVEYIHHDLFTQISTSAALEAHTYTCNNRHTIMNENDASSR